jgi:hypothetical protein
MLQAFCCGGGVVVLDAHQLLLHERLRQITSVRRLVLLVCLVCVVLLVCEC